MVKSQLEFLGRNEIDCVIVGGVAGTLRGSTIPTTDLDVCYARTAENPQKAGNGPLISECQPAQRPSQPSFPARFRNSPQGTELYLLQMSAILICSAKFGGLVITTRQLRGPQHFLGYEFKLIALDKLILAKRTAGRGKDMGAVAELEALLDRKTHPDKH